MKGAARFFSLAFFLSVFLPAGLSASGKTEEPAGEPVNPGWTLCVTALDVSALPPARQMLGGTVAVSLAGALSKLGFRFRGGEESAYYQEYAWAKSRSGAARALAAKRDERDLLIYKGDPAWKYRKNLKAVDEAIAGLEEELALAGSEAPVVEGKPAFTVGGANADGTYVAAPAPGGEYLFCTAQKADAFLAGSLSEYHGRVYLNIKLYTLYTRSYSYEDGVLFSSGDFNAAMDEISGRLVGVVSAAIPSALRVHATPDEAMVILDGSLIGIGETGTHTRSPGEAELELRLDNHIPVTVPLELNAGELTEIFVDLTPLGYNALEADVPGSPGSKVFLGSLYAGETPLALELPAGGFSYVSVETPGGETGAAVFRDNRMVSGAAGFARDGEAGGGARAEFTTGFPVSPEEKRVDRARRGFYGAYGAFWFILPAGIITAGIAGTYVAANNYSVAGGTYRSDYDAYSQNYGKAVTGQYIRGAAYGFIGLSLGVTFFQIFRYLYVSREAAAPIVKDPGGDGKDFP